MDTTNQYYCATSVPTWDHFVDLSFAPSLLFYAYIPIVVVALFFGIWVMLKDKFSFQSKLLLGVSISFSLYILNEILLWVAVYARVIDFGWQMEIIFQTLIWIFSLYFVYFFVTKKDIPFRMKMFLSVALLPILVLFPTSFDIQYFDITNCEAVSNSLWTYVYGVQLFMLAMTEFALWRFYRETQDKILRKQVVISAIGVLVFLGIFFVSIFYGELTKTFEINLIGPAGVVIFIAMLSFMIVRYKAFNIKLIGAQALIVSLVVLIGSEFFFIQNTTNQILTAITLIITGAIGINLIRSVKKEVEQREELAVANKGQENLIHVMNHQIKGYLGTARNIFAELSQSDDYGQMPEQSKPLLNKGLDEMTAGVDYVQQILKGASAHSGTLPYDMKPIDLKSLISDLASKQKEDAEKAGLSFESTIADGDYNMSGDAIMLEEAFKNLITNAILYNNPNGSVIVALSRIDEKILFSVKDTGRGITKEDEKRLYKPGGMGRDSVKINVKASGYGLALVKPVIEKHQGKIWYETEVGKGTTFFVELPVSQTAT